MAGPLSDVRVLDLTSNFMGPYAALLLADMGADVCKIEAPEGDTTRKVGPRRNPGMAVIFLHLNRNKRSMVLDLKRKSGLAALKRMMAGADVLLHSFRPKTLAALGLSYEAAHALNPRLIYCGAFGFGQDGPYADRAAYDDMIQAAVGLPAVQARRTGAPTYVATALADRTVGMALSTAVSMALYRREKTGIGECVEVPMFETFAHFVMGDHLYGLTFDPPIGTWGYDRMTTPDRRPFPTTDGFIGVQVYTDRHWRRFFELSGHPEMADDPRFVDIGARTTHIALLYEYLARMLATRSTAEWLALLVEADIPAVAMNTPETLLDDPHMQAVGFFAREEHPTEGTLRRIGIPQRWSESRPGHRHPAPRLGEHTAELLREYGFTGSEVEQLLHDGGARAAAA